MAIPFDKKHPILLCKQNYFATLITEHVHVRCGHGGVKDTLTEISTKYWFIKGRQFVTKVLYVGMQYVANLKGYITEQ